MKNFNTSIDTYANFCDFINNKVYDILKSVKDIHSFEVSFYFIIDGLKYRVNIKDYRNFSISKKNSDGSYETVCSKKIRNNQSLYKHITRHLDDCWYYKKWALWSAMEEVTDNWTKFAKNYAEASADAMDTLEQFDGNRLDSFWEEYLIVRDSYINENNINGDINDELEYEFDCDSYARHIYSYAVEKGYIKDYDIDYNGKISVETI